MKKLLIAFALAAVTPTLAAETVAGATRVEIRVTEEGFQPREVKLKKGKPATLVFTRVTENTCMTAIDIPEEQVKELGLPLNKPVSVTITPRKAGVEKFHCSAMAMGNGRLIVAD